MAEETRPDPRQTNALPRPPGPLPEKPAIYTIHAASRSEERAWRDLTTSHGGKLRYFYDYLSQTPLKRDGERVFPMKGKLLAGTWECEVGGGPRLQYVVDEAIKRVIVRAVFTSHP